MTGTDVKRVFLEALAVVAMGAAFGVAANALSPRGLALGRNYFPQVHGGSAAKEAPRTLPGGAESAGAAIHARLLASGFQPIDTPEVLRLHRDPDYGQELTVFVDARNDRSYAEGHIPGAWQFDRYYPEEHLPDLLPACLVAARVVVYCTGGECEDSEFAVLTLRDAGVPAEAMAIYVGGFNEWKEHQLPVETGARHSGAITEGSR